MWMACTHVGSALILLRVGAGTCKPEGPGQKPNAALLTTAARWRPAARPPVRRRVLASFAELPASLVALCMLSLI